MDRVPAVGSAKEEATCELADKAGKIMTLGFYEETQKGRLAFNHQNAAGSESNKNQLI
jgi:hypothetical protein